MDWRIILIIISLLVVLAILFTGVIGMAKGGEFNEKYGNKLMVARVVSQFVAVLMIGLLMFS
jgi:hypothetical protein